MTTPIAQLIYISTPQGCDPVQVEDILRMSRVRNARLGITGILVSRADLFLQLLEGPRQIVSNTFLRILEDERHANVTLLGMLDADFRLFGNWDMRGDAMPDWMWSVAEVAAGVPQATPLEQVMALFHRLAALPPQAPA